LFKKQYFNNLNTISSLKLAFSSILPLSDFSEPLSYAVALSLSSEPLDSPEME